MIRHICSHHIHLAEYNTLSPEKDLVKLHVVMTESRSLQNTLRSIPAVSECITNESRSFQNTSGQFRQFQRYHNESRSMQYTSGQTSETAESVNMKAGTRWGASVQNEYPHSANSEGLA